MCIALIALIILIILIVMIALIATITLINMISLIFPPCSLAGTMTSAEGSKKFHYNIPAPLHSTCWMNTFEGSKWSEVGS